MPLNIPCPVKVDCPGTDLPVRNFSSEAPDIPAEPIPFGGLNTPYVPPALSPDSGGGTGVTPDVTPTCPDGYTYDILTGLCASNSGGTNPPLPPSPPPSPFQCPNGEYYNGTPDVLACVPITIDSYSPSPICFGNAALTSFFGVGFSAIPGYPGGLSIEFGEGHIYAADHGFVSDTEIQLSAFQMTGITNILGIGNHTVKLTVGASGEIAELTGGIAVADCGCPENYYYEPLAGACVPITNPCGGQTRFFAESIDAVRADSIVNRTGPNDPELNPGGVDVSNVSEHEMCVNFVGGSGETYYFWYADTYPDPGSYIGSYTFP